jgi:multicomponent Na+:H+ antiporter subunit G
VILNAIAVVLVLSGLFFLLLGVIGILRFPDYYSRTHAVAKAETLGMLLMFSGLIVYLRLGAGSAQLALITGFAFLVNPTATHALARIAVQRRLPSWKREERKQQERNRRNNSRAKSSREQPSGEQTNSEQTSPEGTQGEQP